MGHELLGNLPRTRKWRQVIELMRVGADAAQIANATIRAVEEGFRHAGSDPGVVETMWLLMRIPHAARQPDFINALKQCGLSLSPSAGLLEIQCAIGRAVESRLTRTASSDMGFIALYSAVETITTVLKPQLGSLFSTSIEDVRRVFARYATVKQFSTFAYQFFSRFLNRSLRFFLDRESPKHVGPGERFPTLASQQEFQSALELHCHQASHIIERYSGKWLSKTQFEWAEPVTRERVKRFTSYAMTKLTQELKKGADLYV